MSIERHPSWSRAARGDPEALTIVSADAIELGIGLDKCKVLLLRHEAVLNPSSWYNLGLIFLRLGARDLATHWLRKAAESGHARFMVGYALLSRRGELASDDPEVSTSYLRRAAALGSIQARLLLLGDERAQKGPAFLPFYYWKRLVLSIRNAKMFARNPADENIHRYGEFDRKRLEDTWPGWRKDLSS